MIDVEQQLRNELANLVPAVGPADWGDVLARSDYAPRRARSRWAALAAAAVVFTVIAFATPLGAAIGRGLDGFSSWLTGQPGTPASKSEQQAFDRANARSWLGFPQGTELRRLITATAAGERIELLGFLSGTTLCLRVVVFGRTRGSSLSCAPLGELRHSGAPARVVLVDHGFGRGTKRAWYGVDHFSNAAVQVTAGIAADGVRGIVVEDEGGRHSLPARANAFLYVATDPDVGQRVRRIWAKTASGLVVVPFAPAPFGFGGGSAPTRAATGPTKVERKVSNGTIGWLDRREPRGQPLTVLPGRGGALVRRHTVYGRVIAPDPSRPVRIAVTLSTSRHGGKATGICSWLVLRGGMSGGCSVRSEIFTRSPLTNGVTLMGGSDEFATISGLASDDVARIVAFLANGQRAAVPLADNAFVVDIARAKFPVRLVAYDKSGRVIGFTDSIGDFGGGGAPTRGKARPLLRGVSASGATAELLVGPSTTGGECLYVRWHRNKHAGGLMSNCSDLTTREPPLQLSTDGTPAEFAMGRVRREVATVELRFADGARTTVVPTRGFVLYTVPRAHLAAGHELVAAAARSASGKLIGQESFRPPKR
jgi:hypothetical protein